MKQRTRLMHGGDDLISYNLSKKTDGDTNGEIQLHKMRPQEHFIEAQVQEGDTLQAIALRFYCSISELKRINHIHKDNEIFARRTIKVPVTPYSVLTELIPTQPGEAVPSTSAHVPPTINTTVDILKGTHEINSQGNKTDSKDEFSIDCNAVVLNSTVAPAVVPYTDVDTNDAATEDTQLLPNNKKQKDPVETVVVKQLTSQGADFGLKWFHLLCVILVLGVVVPLLYVIFYVEKEEMHGLHNGMQFNIKDDHPPLYNNNR